MIIRIQFIYLFLNIRGALSSFLLSSLTSVQTGELIICNQTFPCQTEIKKKFTIKYPKAFLDIPEFSVSITQYVEEHEGQFYVDLFNTNLTSFHFQTVQNNAQIHQSEIMGISWVAWENPNIFKKKYEYPQDLKQNKFQLTYNFPSVFSEIPIVHYFYSKIAGKFAQITMGTITLQNYQVIIDPSIGNEEITVIIVNPTIVTNNKSIGYSGYIITSGLTQSQEFPLLSAQDANPSFAIIYGLRKYELKNKASQKWCYQITSVANKELKVILKYPQTTSIEVGALILFELAWSQLPSESHKCYLNCRECTGSLESQCLVCQNGYYLQPTCQKCDQKCRQCTSLNKCSSCIAGLEIIDDFCKCPPGNCEACENVCQTCEHATSCSKCLDSKMVPDQCQCIAGYYLVTRDLKCEQCSKNCTECTGPTQCSKCSRDMLPKSGVCICKDGYFQNELVSGCQGTDSNYQECMNHCIKCIDNQTCLKCSDPQMKTDNLCKCQEGYYLNTVSISCQKCNKTCQSCSTENECIKCSDLHTNLDKTNRSCICQAGFYLSGATCIVCATGCTKCTSKQQCTQCSIGFDFIGQYCTCSKGSYLDNDSCQQCDISCLICDSPGRCSQCKPGYYFSDSTCLQCMLQCLECNDGSSCTKQTAVLHPVNSKSSESFNDCEPNCVKFCSNCDSRQFCNNCSEALQILTDWCKTCNSQDCSQQCTISTQEITSLCKCPNSTPCTEEQDPQCHQLQLPKYECGKLCLNCDTIKGRCAKCLDPNMSIKGGNCVCNYGSFNTEETLCKPNTSVQINQTNPNKNDKIGCRRYVLISFTNLDQSIQLGVAQFVTIDGQMVILRFNPPTPASWATSLQSKLIINKDPHILIDSQYIFSRDTILQVNISITSNKIFGKVCVQIKETNSKITRLYEFVVSPPLAPQRLLIPTASDLELIYLVRNLSDFAGKSSLVKGFNSLGWLCQIGHSGQVITQLSLLDYTTPINVYEFESLFISSYLGKTMPEYRVYPEEVTYEIFQLINVFSLLKMIQFDDSEWIKPTGLRQFDRVAFSDSLLGNMHESLLIIILFYLIYLLTTQWAKQPNLQQFVGQIQSFLQHQQELVPHPKFERSKLQRFLSYLLFPLLVESKFMFWTNSLILQFRISPPQTNYLFFDHALQTIYLVIIVVLLIRQAKVLLRYLHLKRELTQDNQEQTTQIVVDQLNQLVQFEYFLYVKDKVSDDRYLFIQLYFSMSKKIIYAIVLVALYEHIKIQLILLLIIQTLEIIIRSLRQRFFFKIRWLISLMGELFLLVAIALKFNDLQNFQRIEDSDELTPSDLEKWYNHGKITICFEAMFCICYLLIVLIITPLESISKMCSMKKPDNHQLPQIIQNPSLDQVDDRQMGTIQISMACQDYICQSDFNEQHKDFDLDNAHHFIDFEVDQQNTMTAYDIQLQRFICSYLNEQGYFISESIIMKKGLIYLEYGLDLCYRFNLQNRFYVFEFTPPSGGWIEIIKLRLKNPAGQEVLFSAKNSVMCPLAFDQPIEKLLHRTLTIEIVFYVNEKMRSQCISVSASPLLLLKASPTYQKEIGKCLFSDGFVVNQKKLQRISYQNYSHFTLNQFKLNLAVYLCFDGYSPLHFNMGLVGFGADQLTLQAHELHSLSIDSEARLVIRLYQKTFQKYLSS